MEYAQSTVYTKYTPAERENHRLWHSSERKWRGYKPLSPHVPVIPIDASEKSRIQQVSSMLLELPTYADLEAHVRSHNTILDISLRMSRLSLPDEFIIFLENDTSPIRKPEDKPLQNGPIYYRENWRMRVGTPNDLIRRLEMGLAISASICDRFGDTIRQRVLWYGAYGIMCDCDEFDDGSEQKSDRPVPCYAMEAFLNQYPRMKDFARYIIPSTRSLFNGRPFKARAWIPFERPVFDYRVFQRIAVKLCEIFPFLPEGVTKNGVAVAFGAAHNAHEACRFDGYLSSDFIKACEREVCAEEQQRKREDEEREERNRAQRAKRENENRVQRELRARGHKFQETIDPLTTFCDIDPAQLLVGYGFAIHLRGNEWNWHESGQGRSFELDNGVIKPYSVSMQAKSPQTDATKPVNAHRYILKCLYDLDMTRDTDKRALRCRLADNGYGTHPNDYKAIKSAERRAAKQAGLIVSRGNAPSSRLHIDADARTRIERLSSEAVEQILAKHIREIFESDARVHIIISDTGTGKTYQYLTSCAALNKVVIQVSINGNLRDQNFQDAIGFFGADNCINWQGRSTGFENIANIPLTQREQGETFFDVALCPISDVVEKVHKKGIEASIICKRCSLQRECVKHGYLSQYKKLKGIRFLSIALTEILNPNFGNFIKQLQTQGEIKFDTILIDDYMLQQLFVDTSIKISELRRAIRERENGKDTNPCLNAAYKFLDALYRTFDSDISTQEKKIEVYHELEKTMNGYDTEQYDQIREGLAYVVGVDGEALQPDKALDRGMQIESLCRVWSSDWSLVDSVLAFLEDSTPENAPLGLSADYDTAWISHYPRLDRSGIEKLVLMSATANVELTQRAFKDEQVRVYETPAARDKDNVVRLQYDGARITASSFFTFNDTYKATGVKEDSRVVTNLKEIIKLVAASKALTGGKALFTSWKELTKYGNIPNNDLVTAIDETFDTVLHYDSVSGINLNGYKIFVVFGMPKIKIKDIIRTTLKIHANDTEPLQIPNGWQAMMDTKLWHELTEKVIITENGVIIRQPQLKDKQLEQVRWNLTIAKQKQAAGRARFSRWQDTLTLIHSATNIAGFTEYATLYNHTDLENANNLLGLANAATQRQENIAREKQENIERAQKLEIAIARVELGESERAVARDTGISRATLQRHRKHASLRDTDKVAHNSHSLKEIIKENQNCGPPVTLQKQILEILYREKTEITTGEILDAIEGNKDRQVYRELKILTESGQIVRVGQGRYILPPPAASKEITSEKNETPQDLSLVEVFEIWAALGRGHNTENQQIWVF